MSYKKTQTYYRGLDGLRCLAILAVVLYHYIPYRLPGGFLGVDVFLVLSGFLITESILRRREGKGFSYPGYLLKRWLRLTLPLVTMFFFTLAFFAIFAPKFMFNVRQTVWSSLLYVNNWLQIGTGSSYFEAFVNPSPYVHLWYLGVQMQLYLIFPIILLLFLKFSRSKEKTGIGLFIIAIFSAFLMGILFPAGGDPSRVYYGTDTRAFSFLIGSVFAIYQPNIQYYIKKMARNVFLEVGILVLALFLFIFLPFQLGDTSALTYRGGIFLFDVVTGILITFIIHFKPLNQILGFIPLAMVGKMSYSIYLWYYPIFAYFRYGPFATTWIGKYWGVQILILLVIAFFSYLFIEKRLTEAITKGKWRDGFKPFSREGLLRQPKNLVILIIGIVLLTASTVGLINAPSGENETVAQLQARIAENQRKIAEQRAAEKAAAQAQIPDVEGLERPVMLYAYDLQATFIGDSILLSSADALTSVFPNALIDGAVGRQLYNSMSLVNNLKKDGKLSNLSVVVLGTNGGFSDEQLEEFIEAFGKDKKIVFLTTLVPRPWQDEVNKSLKEAAKSHSNVYLLDWYEYAKSHDDWHAPDGVHFNENGGRAMANFIANGLYDLFDKEHKKQDHDEEETKDTPKENKGKKSTASSKDESSKTSEREEE